MTEASPNDAAGRDPAARRRLALYCGVPVGMFTVLSTIGTAFMPYFLSRKPLLLVALSPLFRHIVLASPSVDAWALFAVAVPRHFACDPFVYFLGREYGVAAIEWAETNSPLTGRLARAVEKAFAKVGFLVLLVSPDVLVSTLAGVAGIPFWLFVVANIAGTIATVAVARYFASVLDGPIRALVGFFSAHVGAVTAVSVVLVLFFNWYSRKREPDTGDKDATRD